MSEKLEASQKSQESRKSQESEKSTTTAETSAPSTRFADKHGAAIGVTFGVGLLVLLSVFQSC